MIGQLKMSTIQSEYSHRPKIGRDFFSELGLLLTQTKPVLNVDQKQCLIKKQMSLDFPG